MANILITGGAGYIGSHVLHQLAQSSHNIIVLDNLSTGRKDLIPDTRITLCDLAETRKVEEVFKKSKFDAVIHFAGSIIVPESIKMPLEYYDNNTKNTLELLKLCQKYSVNNFIFSSTAAVYGVPKTGVCTENTPTAPINPYGRSKLMTELMLSDLSNAIPSFNFVALRYFNVAGANINGKTGQCSPRSTHLIKLACETALRKREKLFIYGDDYNTSDGTCIRDYIHVDDLARAHIQALEYLFNGGKSEIINCGYGAGFSVKEVIETVKKVSGVSFHTEVTERRPGDSDILIAKVEKIKKVLGWKPKYNDIELIVKTAIDWESKLGKLENEKY